MICETCGKEHDGSYGSGRFCSDHCRRIWIGRQSNITMKKNGTKKNNLKNSTIRCKSPHGTWRCEKCNIIFNTRHEMYTHKHSFHPIIKGSSWNKGLTKSTDERVAKYVQTCKERGLYNPATKGKHLSTDVKKKISESCKSFYKIIQS